MAEIDRENGYSMIIDFDEEKILFDDYDAFIHETTDYSLLDVVSDSYTDENGDPVMVGSGYFWLSYYDKTLSDPETFTFDENKSTESYYLDEHNLMPVAEPGAAVTENEIKVANLFYPEGCETLRAVSYETRHPNTTVTCEVYLLADNAISPEDGILIERNETSYKYGGFHKINLKNPVLLQKKQPYSVVITQKTEDNKFAVPLSLGYGNSTYAKSYQKSVINEQESMVYSDGTWLDYSEQAVQYTLVPEETAVEENYVFDNFPIKGYSMIAENDINMRVNGGNPWGKMVLADGYDTDKYTLSFTGDKGYEISSDDIEWSLAEGGDSIVDVTVSADKSRVDLKAKKVGTTQLIVNVKNVGTRVINLYVSNMQIGAVSLLDDSFISTYTGEEIKPRVEVMGEDQKTVFEEGKQYTVSYKDNLKCGIGHTIVTPIEDPDEPDTLRPFDMLFVIKPAKTEIVNVTSDGTSALVTVKDEKDWDITGYKVDYREKGSETWTTKTFGPDSPELAVDGLEEGKEYEFKACGYIDIPEEQQIGGIEASYNGDYSDIVTITATEKTFTVTFTDGQGNVLDIQAGIKNHGSAKAPAEPVRVGYKFNGWDVSFEDVTSDLTVNAQWQKAEDSDQPNDPTQPSQSDKSDNSGKSGTSDDATKTGRTTASGVTQNNATAYKTSNGVKVSSVGARTGDTNGTPVLLMVVAAAATVTVITAVTFKRRKRRE